MTQLEAQSWKLPVISSLNCADVVQPKHNGWRLREVTIDAITNILEELVRDPQQVAYCSENSTIDDRFGLEAVGNSLIRTADELVYGKHTS